MKGEESETFWIFTGSGVRLVTGPGDLGCLLHLVACFVAGRPVSPQSNHPARKTGQVAHLVLQKAPFPFGDVGEAAARLPYQVGFYRLKSQTLFESTSNTKWK